MIMHAVGAESSIPCSSVVPVKVVLSCLPSMASALLDFAGNLLFLVVDFLLTVLEPASQTLQ